MYKLEIWASAILPGRKILLPQKILFHALKNQIFLSLSLRLRSLSPTKCSPSNNRPNEAVVELNNSPPFPVPPFVSGPGFLTGQDPGPGPGPATAAAWSPSPPSSSSSFAFFANRGSNDERPFRAVFFS